jgi:hypothetical protein
MQAYRDAFLSPSIFARAHEEYGDTSPSPQTFRWWLTQQGYMGDAAEKAMRCYLESFELINSLWKDFQYDGTDGRPSQEAPTTEVPVRLRREPASVIAERQVQAYAMSQNPVESMRPDFRIKLGNNRWLLIEIKGGEPTERDFIKLEKFARFQRELLSDEDWQEQSDDADDI